MCSQTSPFRQCVHRKVQIANVQLFTGPDSQAQTSKTHNGHWWTCSALFAFRDCSSHKCETLLDNAAPTELVRPALDDLSSFLNCQENLPRGSTCFMIQWKQKEGCWELSVRMCRLVSVNVLASLPGQCCQGKALALRRNGWKQKGVGS